MRVLRTGLCFVSILVAATVSAAPASFSPEDETVETQAAAPEQSLPQSQAERRRVFIFPEDSSGTSFSSADVGRRGRMTPEERRALRRQIDEARQHIDGPRR